MNRAVLALALVISTCGGETTGNGETDSKAAVAIDTVPSTPPVPSTPSVPSTPPVPSTPSESAMQEADQGLPVEATGGPAPVIPVPSPVGTTPTAAPLETSNTVSYVRDGERLEQPVKGSQTGGHAIVRTSGREFSLTIIPFKRSVFGCAGTAAAGVWLRVNGARYSATRPGACQFEVTQGGAPVTKYVLQATISATLTFDGFVDPTTGAIQPADKPSHHPDTGEALPDQIELTDGRVDALVPAGG